MRAILDRIYAKRDWRGDCYEVAVVALIELHRGGVRDVYVVHGEPLGRGPIKGERYGHAWLEVNGEVFDLTVDAEPIDRTVYYALGRIEDPRRYSGDQVRSFLVDSGHYGPWEGPFAVQGIPLGDNK